MLIGSLWKHNTKVCKDDFTVYTNQKNSYLLFIVSGLEDSSRETKVVPEPRNHFPDALLWLEQSIDILTQESILANKDVVDVDLKQLDIDMPF